MSEKELSEIESGNECPPFAGCSSLKKVCAELRTARALIHDLFYSNDIIFTDELGMRVEAFLKGDKV